MTDFIHPNEETRIEEGSKVELHFSVAIEDGVVLAAEFQEIKFHK